MSSQPTPASSAPYIPPVALPGLVPSTHIDIPVCSVLMALFVAIFLASIAVLRQNARDNAIFHLVALFVIYSVVSCVALALRIACAAASTNASLSLAANIIANVGVVVLIVLHLLLMPHLMRKSFGVERTGKGWRKKVSVLPFVVLIPLMPIMLLVNINTVILSFFILDQKIRLHCVTAQKVALVVFAVAAFVPVPASLLVAMLGPKASPEPTSFVDNEEKSSMVRVFNIRPGKGSAGSTALVMFLASSLLAFGASMRAATLLLPARPAQNPAWYHERAAYYVFTYAVEVIVVSLHLVYRLDRRLQMPGACAKERGQRGELNGLAN